MMMRFSLCLCCFQVVNVYKAGVQQTLDILFLRGGSDFITSSDCVSRDSADRTLIAWDYQTTATVSNQIYHVRTSVCEGGKRQECPMCKYTVSLQYYQLNITVKEYLNDIYYFGYVKRLSNNK